MAAAEYNQNIEIKPQDHSMQHNQLIINKQWPNGFIPLCFKPKNCKDAMNGFRTANHTNDRPGTALELLPSTVTHRQE